MNKPMVACIMLVNGRSEMVKRAIASFKSQTYERKRLLVYDSGSEASVGLLDYVGDRQVLYFCRPNSAASIGTLRNLANRCAIAFSPLGSVDAIAHWDSDDWSHPLRLEEQVALLQSSGKAAVGYNDMLFWDTTKTDHCKRIAAGVPFLAGTEDRSEAWLYQAHHPTKFLGSSMLYTRAAWEACPFHPDEPYEDQIWWMKNQSQCHSVSSLPVRHVAEEGYAPVLAIEPRMVCAIHGGNTSEAYAKRVPAHWRRMPNWNRCCAEAMKL